MTARNFKVWRGDATGGQLNDYKVEVNEGEVVLDIIHRLQATQEPDLACRWNCKAGKCGSCSMEINGMPRLSCMTRMSTFEENETVTVTPLRAFPVIRDLVTDVSYNYEKARELPAFAPPAGLKPGEYRMQQIDVERSQEFRKCIECFLCQNTCHVVRDHEDNKKEFAGSQQGLGYCNITKCCTEVCPEHIKITDNAIIPMKERVVDRRYDPLVMLGRKILRRDQIAPLAATGPTVHAGPVTVDDSKAPVDFGRELLPPMTAAVNAKGRVDLNETLSDRSAAASPFGDDITFPVDPAALNYYHPDKK